jgi:hypothetical protein
LPPVLFEIEQQPGPFGLMSSLHAPWPHVIAFVATRIIMVGRPVEFVCSGM